MFRKSKITNPVIAESVREISNQRVLAFAEAEVVEEVVSNEITETAPAQDAKKLLSEGEEGLTFTVTGELAALAITAKKLVAVSVTTQATLIDAYWFQIDRAAWEPNSRLLKVVFATGRAPMLFRVAEKSPMEFLALFRERVDSSVVIAETIPLTSAENVRVAVRRDEFGDLFVQAIADPNVDLTHPLVRKKVEPVVDRLREVSGAR